MGKHVIKYEYRNGEFLTQPILWCGVDHQTSMEFTFKDAQHVALAVGGSMQPCKDCVKAIIEALSVELP